MPISQILSNSSAFSFQEPVNPTEGFLWHELDSNQNVVENWYRKNSNWQSKIYKLSNHISFSGSSSILYASLDLRYNYLFTNLNVCVFADAALTASSYLQLNISRLISSSVNSPAWFTQTYNSLNANQTANYNSSLNYFLSSSNASMLNFSFTRTSSNGFNSRFSFSLDYLLIRK